MVYFIAFPCKKFYTFPLNINALSSSVLPDREASFSLAALSANMFAMCFTYRFVSFTETRITQNSISQNYTARQREIAGWKRLIVWNTADRLVLDHVFTCSPGFNKYSRVVKVLSGWSCHNLSGL